MAYVAAVGPATEPASFPPQHTELPLALSTQEYPSPATICRTAPAPVASAGSNGRGCAPPVTKPGTVWWMLVQASAPRPERPSVLSPQHFRLPFVSVTQVFVRPPSPH